MDENKVLVKNPQGKIGTINKNELENALATNYTIPTDAEAEHYKAVKEAGEGLGPLVTFGEAAASAATLGLSRQIERAFGRTSAEQKIAAEAAPTAEKLGTGLGIVGGLLLAPESGAGEAAISGTEAATGGLKALGEHLPINMVGKAGEAVAEKAAPLIGKGASLIARPETRPIANAILKSAGEAATGSMVEGALFGLGQSIDENALGDPDALGDKLFANVGFGAALGGGLGAVIGAGKGLFNVPASQEFMKRFSRKEANTILPSEAAAASTGQDVAASLAASDIAESKKDDLIEEIRKAIDLNRKKAIAPELERIAAERGLTPTAGQIFDSKAVQFADDWLTHSKSPTPAAMRYAQEAETGFKKAGDVVKDMAGAESERMTEFEAGKKIRDELTGAMREEIKTNSEIWNEVAPYAEAIPVNDRGINQMVKALERSPELTKFAELEGSKFAKKFIRMFERAENLADLEKLRKSIYSELTAFDNPNTKEMAAKLYWKIDDAFERYVEKFAGTMKTPEAQQKVLDVVANRRAAKEGFKAFIEKYQPLLEGLGSRGDKTSSQMIKFVESMNAQKLIGRMFQKGDIEFTQDVQKRFPEFFEIARQHEVGKLIAASRVRKTGEFNPKEFLIRYEKLAPEVKDLMFDAPTRKGLEDMRKWFGSYPDKFNPSASGYTHAAQTAFSGLTQYGIAAARDAGMKKLIDYAAMTGDVEGARQMYALRGIEKAQQAVTTRISNGVKALVSDTRDIITVEGIKEHEYTPEEHKKVVEMVNRYNTDPEKFMDDLHRETEALSDAAPKTAQAMVITMARANQYLAQKIPTGGQNSFLSGQYEPSKAEMAKFERFHGAITNPLGILIQAQKGTLTPESVDAVRNVMPTLMQEIQGKIMEEMSKKGHELKNLPLNKKLGLSLLMGEDLFNGLQQEKLQANQAALMNPGAQQATSAMDTAIKTSLTGLSKLSVAHRSMTDVEKNAERKMLS